MRETRSLMGMPITVEVVGENVTQPTIDMVFDYFDSVDKQFSLFKSTSEISRINVGEIKPADYSIEMRQVFALAEQTKTETNGYFDIGPIGNCNPSGVVKGWAIYEAAKLLDRHGFDNYYVDAGGDIQVDGHDSSLGKWRIGIRNPFNKEQIIKVLEINNEGVATSGTYERGEHIYNPKTGQNVNEIVSLTVIGQNILEADRIATGAFAMGKKGIELIESISGLEGYMIDKTGIATMTTGFNKYVVTGVETNDREAK